MGKMKAIIVLLVVAACILVGNLLAPGPAILAGGDSGVFIQYDSRSPEAFSIAGTGVTDQQSTNGDMAFPAEPQPRPFLEQVLNQLGLLVEGR
ncbi:MAG: hypothetical protein M1305_03580 [Candidatus Marsarchaeota archaeon]|nr:hypothetical protein [Candidatus Marsarchaeota archaeon]